MSLPVYITTGQEFTVGLSVTLTGPEGRHAVTVKRHTPGERIIMTDSAGRGAAECTITATEGKDTLVATVVRSIDPASLRRRPLFTVIQAIPKSDRSELAVDLAVQGGADAIIPWEASRCIAKWVGAKRTKAVAKWQATATAAAKQSRRLIIPQVSTPQSTDSVCQFIEDFDGLVLVLHEEAFVTLADVPGLKDTKNLAVIVGPEGGIDPHELVVFQTAGAVPVILGGEVLRCATAALAALSAAGAVTGRWYSRS